MTDSLDECGELLRRALSAEADSVVPSPDGLEIIRTRIERRGLRGLMWWRAGASVAGAVLVAATVVMMVPQLRHQVTERVQSGEVNFTESTSPDLSATSRPPVRGSQQPLSTPRPGTTAPQPSPSPSPTASKAPPATATPTPSPSRPAKATPSPTCPTSLGNATTVEPEGPAKTCKETEPPTPAPSEFYLPCRTRECPPTDATPAPFTAEVPQQSPIGN